MTQGKKGVFFFRKGKMGGGVLYRFLGQITFFAKKHKMVFPIVRTFFCKTWYFLNSFFSFSKKIILNLINWGNLSSFSRLACREERVTDQPSSSSLLPLFLPPPLTKWRKWKKKEPLSSSSSFSEGDKGVVQKLFLLRNVLIRQFFLGNNCERFHGIGWKQI